MQRTALLFIQTILLFGIIFDFGATHSFAFNLNQLDRLSHNKQECKTLKNIGKFS